MHTKSLDHLKIEQIPHFICIEGCIGVGKTHLAKRLGDTFYAELLLEQAQDNPFLKKFYKQPKDTALATQLFFLFQRAQQLDTLRQHDLFSHRYVADFIIDKDLLFAKVNLSADEFKLYEQVHSTLDVEPPTPDLMIYLQAPVDVLMERIRMRGRDYERNMDARYLEQLNQAYSEYFYYYNASPLLIINVAELDLVNNESDYNQLVDYILKAKSGRQYFNPTFLA